MAETDKAQPANRFGAVFKAMMVFCVLVWMWGLGLLTFWPWQKGGEWLPEFPIVAVCADDRVCAIPFAELAADQASGKVKTLLPPSETGETAYDALVLRWKRLSSGVETKVSAWNFQISVRYRIDNEVPVLVEYQEIGAKVFLIAMAGALLSLIGLYWRRLRR